MNSACFPVWAREGSVLTARGPLTRIDPGTGPGRYARARAALAQSGRHLALASFTFDPDDPGSVVLVPDEVVKIEASRLGREQSPTPEMTVIDSGIDDWADAFVGALDSIEAELVDKVVLTRQVTVEFAGHHPEPADLVARLAHREQGCLVYSVDGLVGASPELLVALRNRRVSSLALAGTASEAEELHSDKMDREHELSRTSVLEGLAGLVSDLSSDERSVRVFGPIKHLATRFEGEVEESVDVLDLVASLHPTAAVAGVPTDTSLKVIKDLERRSRGRYAGPVGWFDSSGEGEFAIALRCGLFEGSRATLFAGGGIVRGSERDLELAETELKLRPMLRALGQID